MPILKHIKAIVFAKWNPTTLIIVASALFLVLTTAVGLTYYTRKHNIYRHFKEPSKATHSFKNSIYLTKINKHSDHERDYYIIKIVRNNRDVIFEKRVTIYASAPTGMGFVHAMQVDGDSEYEIVVWGNIAGGWVLHSCEAETRSSSSGKNRYKSTYDKTSFYLDFVNGSVVEVPFCRAPDKTKALVSEWAMYQYKKPLQLVVSIFSLALLLLVPALAYVLVHRHRKSREKLGPERKL